MGYETHYKLQTIPPSEFNRVHETIVGNDYDPFDDACKWYDHETDLRVASEKLRDVIIRVDGEGEDSGDVWTLYAFNGQVVKHKQSTWEPPEPPAEWLAAVSTSHAQASHEVTAEDVGAHTMNHAMQQLLNAPKYRATCPVGKDAHTWTAACMFGVKYEDVTPQQRQIAKQACFGA
jgi:hypothetical protein